MSMFDRKSRFVKYAKITQATDRRGRLVSCVTPAEISEQPGQPLSR